MDGILHLTIKKKWFDLIASGRKTVEYRDDKEYWRRRLITTTGEIRPFREIHFRNGYRKDSPTMRVEWLGCEWVDFVPWVKNGEDVTGPVFEISLGKVLEIGKEKDRTS